MDLNQDVETNVNHKKNLWEYEAPQYCDFSQPQTFEKNSEADSFFLIDHESKENISIYESDDDDQFQTPMSFRTSKHSNSIQKSSPMLINDGTTPKSKSNFKTRSTLTKSGGNYLLRETTLRQLYTNGGTPLYETRPSKTFGRKQKSCKPSDLNSTFKKNAPETPNKRVTFDVVDNVCQQITTLNLDGNLVVSENKKENNEQNDIDGHEFSEVEDLKDQTSLNTKDVSLNSKPETEDSSLKPTTESIQKKDELHVEAENNLEENLLDLNGTIIQPAQNCRRPSYVVCNAKESCEIKVSKSTLENENLKSPTKCITFNIEDKDCQQVQTLIKNDTVVSGIEQNSIDGHELLSEDEDFQDQTVLKTENVMLKPESKTKQSSIDGHELLTEDEDFQDQTVLKTESNTKDFSLKSEPTTESILGKDEFHAISENDLSENSLNVTIDQPAPINKRLSYVVRSPSVRMVHFKEETIDSKNKSNSKFNDMKPNEAITPTTSMSSKKIKSRQPTPMTSKTTFNSQKPKARVQYSSREKKFLKRLSKNMTKDSCLIVPSVSDSKKTGTSNTKQTKTFISKSKSQVSNKSHSPYLGLAVLNYKFMNSVRQYSGKTNWTKPKPTIPRSPNLLTGQRVRRVNSDPNSGSVNKETLKSLTTFKARPIPNFKRIQSINEQRKVEALERGRKTNRKVIQFST